MGDTKHRAEQREKRELHQVHNRNFRQLVSNSIANQQTGKKKKRQKKK